jgi:hypothetical protein
MRERGQITAVEFEDTVKLATYDTTVTLFEKLMALTASGTSYQPSPRPKSLAERMYPNHPPA